MPEHRKMRLAFLNRFGRDLHQCYIVQPVADRFFEYEAFDIQLEKDKFKGKRLRLNTLRQTFFRSLTTHFMRHALVRFPDRKALIAHMKKHDYAFDYIPEK